MTQTPNNKQNLYDLEERTLKFTKRVIQYIKILPLTLTNKEISKQLIRSAGSIGANYIEANESLSKKDFIMRVKICKKESKESQYWLKLSEPDSENKESAREKETLTRETIELMKIFGSILEKTK